MTSGPGPVAPSIPQQVTAADRDSAGIQHRHPDSANSARRGHASEYSLLALVEPAGDPAATRTQVSRESHRTTRGKEDQCQRATKTSYSTGQHALLACGMPEDNDRGRRPPK